MAGLEGYLHVCLSLITIRAKGCTFREEVKTCQLAHH